MGTSQKILLIGAMSIMSIHTCLCVKWNVLHQNSHQFCTCITTNNIRTSKVPLKDFSFVLVSISLTAGYFKMRKYHVAILKTVI